VARPRGSAREVAVPSLPAELAQASDLFDLEVLELTSRSVEGKLREALGAERELEAELLAHVRSFFASKRHAILGRN
jgi:hypothetical protein